VSSKFITHRTLEFDFNLSSHNIFKLEVVLVNKGWFCTRLQNQLRDNTFMTLENNIFYTRVINNGGPCSDEELDSNDKSAYHNQFIFLFTSTHMLKKSHDDCLRL
jgi:hypothetical protein